MSLELLLILSGFFGKIFIDIAELLGRYFTFCEKPCCDAKQLNFGGVTKYF